MLTEFCPGCRITLPRMAGSRHAYLGASPSCWSTYSELLAREYADPALMRVHRATVDAYCAQHPGVSERRTVQSINIHLVGLHLIVERGLDGDFARRIIGIVADRLGYRLNWLDPPDPPGDVTVLHPLAALDADAHEMAVLLWARSVWEAWRGHHGTISASVDEALSLA